MEKTTIINPYDEKQRNQIRQYEQQLSEPLISNNLDQIVRSTTQEKYRKQKKQSNEVNEYIVLEDSNKIIGICQLYGVKDIKSCQIVFIGTELSSEKRLLISATEYAMNSLGMIAVFINLSKPNRELEKYLLAKGFESLDEENGKKIFLKEKNNDKNNKETNYETARKS